MDLIAARFSFCNWIYYREKKITRKTASLYSIISTLANHYVPKLQRILQHSSSSIIFTRMIYYKYSDLFYSGPSNIVSFMFHLFITFSFCPFPLQGDFGWLTSYKTN